MMRRISSDSYSPKLLLRYLVLEEAVPGSLGLLRVAGVASR
jgi:hypothetical protein